MNTNKLIKYGMMALLVVGAAGCKKNVKKDPSGKGELSASAEKAKDDKFGTYVKCKNEYGNLVSDALRDYFKWVSKDGPTGKERYIRGIRKLHTEPTECVKQMRTAAKLTPEYPALDKPALEFADSLEKLAVAMKAADSYYELKDYTTKGWALGNEYHKVFVEQGKRFFKARDELSMATQAIEEENAANDLKEAEAKGRTVEANNVRFWINAKKLMKLADDIELDEPVNSAKIKQFEVAKVDMRAAYDKMSEYWEKDKAKAKTQLRGFSADHVYSDVVEEAKKFVQDANEFTERFQKEPKKRFDTSERSSIEAGNLSWVKGTSGSMVKVYNSFIGKLNRIQYVQ